MGKSRPRYYLAARSYTERSAGIKAMHILCHTLNELGAESFLVPIDNPFMSNPNLNTPMIKNDQKFIEQQQSRSSVTVYDESITGNPLRGDLEVKWMLNNTGFLSGNVKTKKHNNTLSFVFAKEIQPDLPRLVMNTVDYDFFSKEDKGEPRNLKLFYAGKLRSLGVELVVPPESIEIFRSGDKSQSREDLRYLLSKAKVLYLAEDSSIALEAAICGCPTVHLHEYFRNEPLSQEDGGVGLARSDKPQDLALVNLDPEFIGRYVATLEIRALCDTLNFILIVDAKLNDVKPKNRVRSKFPIKASLSMRFRKLLAGWRYSGFRGVFGVLSDHWRYRK